MKRFFTLIIGLTLFASCGGGATPSEHDRLVKTCENELKSDVGSLSMDLLNSGTFGMGSSALELAGKKAAFEEFIFSKLRPSIHAELDKLSNEELKKFQKDGKQRILLAGKKLYENKDIILESISGQYEELQPFIESFMNKIDELEGISSTKAS